MIRELRHGDQTRLSKVLGISLRHMNDIIKGRRKPSYDLAKKLEKVTGINRQAWVWPDDFPNPLIHAPELHSQNPPNDVKKEGRNHETCDP